MNMDANDDIEVTANCTFINEEVNTKFVTYKRRYVSLSILLFATALVFFQFYLYAAIGHVVIDFYEVSYETVNTATLLPDIAMLFLFYGIGRFIDIYGFRITTLLCLILNLIANFVKCFTIHKSLFWLLMTANAVVGITSFMLMACGPVFAAQWFKANEVANVIGATNAISTLGIIISFLPPALTFANVSSMDDIEYGLMFITYLTAAVSLVVCIVSFLFLEDTPKTPPSLAQQIRTSNEPISKLFKNRNALIIICEYCINATLIVVLGITLNQSLLSSFKNDVTILTVCGVLVNASGIPGALFTGLLIQKYPNYKILNIFHGLLYVIFTSAYILSLRFSSVILVYISIFALGYISSALFVLLMDFLVEVTYPFKEGMLFSFANTICVVPSFPMVPLITTLSTHYNPVIANKTLLAIAVVYVSLSFFTKEDLRRRRANESQAKTTVENNGHVNLLEKSV